MKKCPFCAEEIQDEALVCRYCGRSLVVSPVPKKKSSGCGLAILITGLVGFGFIFFILVIVNVANYMEEKKTTTSKKSPPSHLYQEKPEQDPMLASRGSQEEVLNNIFAEKNFPFRAKVIGEKKDIVLLQSDSVEPNFTEDFIKSLSDGDSLKSLKEMGFSKVDISSPKLMKTINLVEMRFPETSFGNGTFIVGEDIKPGTYKTEGSEHCYYERLRGFSGEMGDILANENASGPAIVTIKATDKGFSSTGCARWEKIK